MIDIADKDGIAVLTMQHGKANALDLEFCNALAATFAKLASSSARAAILTGQGKIFSAGVDLVRLNEGGPSYTREFLPVLHRAFAAIFDFPKPIVAALNGHTIAGGCVLACAAERRIMADGAARVGVTELQVGVPFPPLALEIMRHVVAPHFLEEVILGASTYAPADALARGLINEIVPADALTDRAMAAAQHLAAISPPAYALSKRQLRQPANDRVKSETALRDDEITGLWVADASTQRVRDYVSRTLKKG